MPFTSSTVMRATMSVAGRLKAIAHLPRCGADAAMSAVCAVWTSVASQAGKSTPNAPRKNERQ
jgi:hypothetical protein